MSSSVARSKMYFTSSGISSGLPVQLSHAPTRKSGSMLGSTAVSGSCASSASAGIARIASISFFMEMYLPFKKSFRNLWLRNCVLCRGGFPPCMMRNDEGWGVVPNGGNFFARDCIHAGDFAPAGATRGQWKRTKFAVAPLTPSQHPPMQQCGYVCKNNESIQTKNFR